MIPRARTGICVFGFDLTSILMKTGNYSRQRYLGRVLTYDEVLRSILIMCIQKDSSSFQKMYRGKF